MSQVPQRALERHETEGSRSDAVVASSREPPGLPLISPFYPSLHAGGSRVGTSRIGIGAGLLVLVVATGVGLIWTHLSKQQAILQAEVERLQSEVMLLAARTPSVESSEVNFKKESGLNKASVIGAKIPLTVLSSPEGAAVDIDGMPVGTTPLLSHYLDPGAYIVRVATKAASKEQVIVLLADDGPQTISFVLSPVGRSQRAQHQPRKPDVEIEAFVPVPVQQPVQEREENSRSIQVEEPVTLTGRIIVGSTPAGAQVRLSGRTVGKTPVDLRDLASGTYTVTVEQDGYERWTSHVHIDPGQHLTLQAELNPSPRKKRIGW